MEKEYEFHEILKKTIVDIEDFCQNSFKIAPERCMPFVISFIQHMDQLVLGFAPKQVKKVEKMLPKIFESLQHKDYVLIRDYLNYEMKPFLEAIQNNAKI